LFDNKKKKKDQENTPGTGGAHKRTGFWLVTQAKARESDS